MPPVIQNICFDCRDAYALAEFWSEVLGLPMDPDDTPGAAECGFDLPTGQSMLFLEVPEPKSVKNRAHVCLTPDVPRDDEVARLLGIGATMYDDQRNPDGSGWVVLKDPEENEFCVLRSDAERSAGTAEAPAP